MVLSLYDFIPIKLNLQAVQIASPVLLIDLHCAVPAARMFSETVYLAATPIGTANPKKAFE